MSVILPAAYLPNIEYFCQLLKSDQVIISTNETYPKQTYRNRCVIMNANGLQKVSVPVERHPQDALMADIRISYAEDWQKNHLRSIESAYRRTPYYEYYFDPIAEIISRKQAHLADLNFELTSYIADKIGLSCEMATSNVISIAHDLVTFLNPNHKTNFSTQPYIQAFQERFGFQSNLSIIDLLFNEGPNSICILQESLARTQVL